jgi:O-antigen ligase
MFSYYGLLGTVLIVCLAVWLIRRPYNKRRSHLIFGPRFKKRVV